MNYSQRMYSKTELGLLYFPDTTDGATARRHIMIWIKRCEAGGIKKRVCHKFMIHPILVVGKDRICC